MGVYLLLSNNYLHILTFVDSLFFLLKQVILCSPCFYNCLQIPVVGYHRDAEIKDSPAGELRDIKIKGSLFLFKPGVGPNSFACCTCWHDFYKSTFCLKIIPFHFPSNLCDCKQWNVSETVNQNWTCGRNTFCFPPIIWPFMVDWALKHHIDLSIYLQIQW